MQLVGDLICEKVLTFDLKLLMDRKLNELCIKAHRAESRADPVSGPPAVIISVSVCGVSDLLGEGHGAGRVPAGAERRLGVFLDEGQVVSRPQLVLQVQRRADAAQLPVRDDGDPVAQDVGLVHVVSGQDDGSS